MQVKFSFFLLVVVVTAVPQDFRNSFRNEIDKISLPGGESSSFNIDENRDEAIENFLKDAMENYHTWLAKEDPLDDEPGEVILNTTDLDEGELDDLDAVLTISYQYMQNHSKSGLRTEVTALSVESLDILTAGRRDYDGEDVKFGADFTVTGSMNVNDTFKVPFRGSGKLAFRGNNIQESFQYIGYTVDENGYIDLSKASTKTYMFYITWNSMFFEALYFDYNGETDVTWMPKLKDQLGELYWYFLADHPGFAQFTEHNLPKRHLQTYLQEILSSTKLEDIVSEWQPRTTEFVTTEPTTLQETKTTNPPDTSNGNLTVLSFWALILTLMTVYVHV